MLMLINRDDGIPPDPLTKLPLEILQTVISGLSVPDAASFSLCNRRLAVTFGDRYWSLVHSNGNNSYRSSFLRTIARDIPSWFFCRWCSHLHPRDRIGPPGPALQPKQPLHCLESRLQPNLWPYISVHQGK